jgi:hypothetical protein
MSPGSAWTGSSTRSASRSEASRSSAGTRVSRRTGAARIAVSTRQVPSAVRVFIRVAARTRWAGAVGGGGVCWSVRVDAPGGVEQRWHKMPVPAVGDQGCD